MLLVVIVVLVLVGCVAGVLALRTRPRGERGRSAAWAVGVASVAFGVGVPVAVIVANSGVQSREGPAGIRLTAFQQDGRQVFARRCATCHTLAAASAIAKVGRNLDELRPSEALVRDAILKGRARGRGQMPVNLVRGREARAVAAFVAATAGR